MAQATHGPTLEVTFKETAGWKQAQPQDDVLREKWWELFGDPLLNALEEQVNVSNQTIAVAEAQFRAARAAIGIVRSGLFPELNVGATALTSQQAAPRTAFLTFCLCRFPMKPMCGGASVKASRPRSRARRQAPPTLRLYA